MKNSMNHLILGLTIALILSTSHTALANNSSPQPRDLIACSGGFDGAVQVHFFSFPDKEVNAGTWYQSILTVMSETQEVRPATVTSSGIKILEIIENNDYERFVIVGTEGSIEFQLEFPLDGGDGMGTFSVGPQGGEPLIFGYDTCKKGASVEALNAWFRALARME